MPTDDLAEIRRLMTANAHLRAVVSDFIGAYMYTFRVSGGGFNGPLDTEIAALCHALEEPKP